MADSIKIDSEKLKDVCGDVLLDVFDKLTDIEGEIECQKIPIDPNLENIDTSGFLKLLFSLMETAIRLLNEIYTIADNFNNVEKMNNFIIGVKRFFTNKFPS